MGYRQCVLVKRAVSSSLHKRARRSYLYSNQPEFSLHHLAKSSQNDAQNGCLHDQSILKYSLKAWRGLIGASTSSKSCGIDQPCKDVSRTKEDQCPKETVLYPKRETDVVSRYEREYVVGFGGIKTLRSQGYGKWRVVHYDINGCTQAQCITWIHTSSPHLSKSIPDAVPRRSPDENDEKQEKTLNIGAEPTPEQCDEAVVDLSSAKAKAKKVQEVQSKEASILTKIWSVFLGIGPMLKAIASMSREDWVKKMVHLKDDIRDTLKHYWVGFKLLWADTRISSRLLIKLAGGKSLTRRERRQLLRTTADIFRLVPFAVFIIVPFMEFLLPVFLKLFPNMLPSTFQDKMKEQEALKRRLNARIEYAKFLQDTVKQMAEEIKTTRSGDLQRTAEDLDEFMNKVRVGDPVTNEEILGFAKLFNDELTLDNISRPRLVSMCKYMGIQPYGTDAYLRHMLRSKLSGIKNDDRMIQIEGIDSLSEAELRTACRERGMLGLLSVEEMRRQLRDWLDLSLKHSVPSSLLILSRSFLVSGKVRPEEAVQATLSSLPDEVVESVGVTALPSEDALSERVRKLEYLQKQEELIKEETEKEETQQVKLEQDAVDQAVQDLGINVAQEPTAKILPGMQEDLSKLTGALAVLASSSFISKERTEFLRLVNKEIELYNKMVTTDGATEARKAFEAAHEDVDHSAFENKVSSALVERIDAMLHNLEKELDSVDAVIGDQLKILDRDSDGKVTPEEVAAAAMFVKDTLGREPVQELIKNLAKDEDGKILVEDILRLGAAMELEEAEKEHSTSVSS